MMNLLAIISPHQAENEAVVRWAMKIAWAIVIITAIECIVMLCGRLVAKCIVPQSETGQKTVRMMWRTLGHCTAAWAAFRILFGN